ncbi:DUF4396 domain-containing protein [Streptomyces sp. NPDC048290]|uniref:DUF4396 domain-containing protein n=1 Tax=Streptomyces sp. NPDC048290 TaxID=3155811 RepID=UPI00342A2FD2
MQHEAHQHHIPQHDPHHPEQPHGPGEHAEHGAHGEHAAHTPDSDWPTAIRATLHCLTGCATGEVLGMVIGTALGWHNAPTMILAITLAFIFGYSFTLYGVLRAGLGFKAAVKVALAADTVSIIVMETVDNGVIALWPGAMDAHLDTWLFWGVLAIAFVVAFVVTVPINKWLIGRGKGHAVVHQYH